MLRPLRAARGQKPGVQLAAIDVHNHAMPLPLLEWFERTRLSATNTYRTRCLGYASGWPRGDARGSFHSYSDARRGASPLRLPACRAGQQCVSPSSCRPGPRSSRSGSVFPRSRTRRPRPATRALMLLFPLVATRASPIREPGRPARQPPAPRRRRPCPQTPGRACRGGSHAWPGKFLLSCRWLTIKHHLQAREDGKPIIWTSASYCHRHSPQVPPPPALPMAVRFGPMPKSRVSQSTVFGAQRLMLRTLHDRASTG